jgi:hypothetical protein
MPLSQYGSAAETLCADSESLPAYGPLYRPCMKGAAAGRQERFNVQRLYAAHYRCVGGIFFCFTF